ncbi:hypothetical protein [Pseudarthrobacter sp. NamB4]|uniref:hypothetical protein n=1 Tax=Pseudarthrobacter sp. NamB4 TaxID=2576837 RepID=UPI001275723F|nr:hypothetical protein [Pseudarthrobacter sp. NamB4]TLM74508.1 H-NS histone family protein [Pseudarthrobacter sp. NamB4]
MSAAPSTALAQFTDTKASSTLYTTGPGTPAAADVTMVCTNTLLGILGWSNVVTVNEFSPVARATSYEIRIFDAANQLRAQADSLEQLSIHSAAKPDTWRYELRAKYAVPANPSNVWSGKPLLGPLTCAGG